MTDFIAAPLPAMVDSSVSSSGAVESQYQEQPPQAVNTVRLDYGSIQNCGIRQQELGVLLGYASSGVDTEKPVVWVEAEAGVGKSALLQQFREKITSNGKAITISGKFEERAAASEPFAAVREAVAELAEYILTRENKHEWAQELQERLGTDMGLVLSILSALRPCFRHSLTNQESRCDDSEDSEEKYGDEDAFGNFSTREYRFVRFRLAFRTLIRFTCAKLAQDTQQTLVFLLDDFHWIDLDSLQVIKTLMEDAKKPTNFFLLTATRPLDEFAHIRNLYQTMVMPDIPQTPTSPTGTTMSESLRLSRSSSRHHGGNRKDNKLRVMGVSRLSAEEIADILKGLLGRKDVQEFADIVKGKTQGNPFVVIQFLRLLERSGHLYYSYDKKQWQFDVQSIAHVDQIADNVSQVVAQSLKKGDRRRRSALMVAASFGVSQFDVSTIVHGVSVLEQQEETTASESTFEEDYEDPYVVKKRVTDMSCELTEAALEGLVEETAPGHYRFQHDRIRESAYSLLPPGDARKEVHLRVGRQLRSWMDTQSELGLGQSGFSKESLLLHATKQLNAGASLINDDWELLDLVDLNYQAAELAASKTAFFSSIEYLQVGLSLLEGQEAWSRYYDRVLKFYVALTRMQYSCGLPDECWETSTAVIDNAKTFREKSGIYHTRILCLMQRELMDEALDLTLEVFEMMGQALPRRFVMAHALRDMMKARKFLNETSDEELLSLPVVYDEDLEMELDFLQDLAEIGFVSGRFGYVMLVSFRYVMLVAERGNYPRSFYATSLWACFFKAQFCDFPEAMHYGTLATKLSEKQRTAFPGFAARCDDMVLSYVHHWQAPLRPSLAPTIDAFQRLWTSGLVDTYLMDVCALLWHYFAAGEPVQKTLKECERSSEACEDYQQMYHWHTNASQHQAMLNLQGKCDNPAILKGGHMDIDVCRENWMATSNKPALYASQFWSLFLGYLFGDLRSAKQSIKAMRADLMEDGSTVLVPLRLFYSALVYFSVYRSTRKSKYRRRANKPLKVLQNWSEKGAVNCVFMYQLLEAEDFSSQTRPVETTLKAYDTAITSATELGLQHHMALANELAGAYLLLQNQEDRASGYLNRAVHLYGQWGAVAKVKSMQSKFGPYIDGSNP